MHGLDDMLKRHKILEAANQTDECSVCKKPTDKRLRNEYKFTSEFLVVHFEQNSNNSNRFDFDSGAVFLADNYFTCELVITFDHSLKHYLCYKRKFKNGWIQIDSLRTSYTKPFALSFTDFPNISMLLLKKAI